MLRQPPLTRQSEGNIAWLCAFLDFPAAAMEAGRAFWQALTASTVSASRGDRGQFAALLPPDGDSFI